MGQRFLQSSLLIIILASAASGQEMEPRAYSPAPVGTQFVLVGYGHQSGDVLLDSSLPLRDVKVNLNLVTAGYGRTFDLAGKQANVAVLVPYIWGNASGTVFEDNINVRRSGGGDLRLRFSMLLKGGDAMKPKEFATRKPGLIVGTSVSIIAPTGQYDPARLVNPGSNRWAFKPEVGVSKPRGRWTMELMGGTWLFTPNRDFFGGARREQKPLLSLQAHLIYTLRQRMWVSVNGTYFAGGQTEVNGILNDDRQRNARIGATFSYPLTQQQSIKVAWAKGVTTRIGGDLNMFVVGWQYAWFK
ncbi:MAG TPA: transporter [Pyrinomonadaceae bacterium]|nr:transporter [Pyrinomonadaceae bacterium]